MTLTLTVELLAAQVAAHKNESLLIEMLTRHIVTLERRLQAHKPKILTSIPESTINNTPVDKSLSQE